MLQVSPNAAGYHDDDAAPLLRACAQLVDTHAAVVSLHLDHLSDTALLDHAELETGLGVSSVMYDASREDYATNVARTREVSRRLHDPAPLVQAVQLGADRPQGRGPRAGGEDRPPRNFPPSSPRPEWMRSP